MSQKQQSLYPDITTAAGYMDRFWQLVSENQHFRDPMRKALFSLESELLSKHGVRRYTTYFSFSAAKTRGCEGIRLTVYEVV